MKDYADQKSGLEFKLCVGVCVDGYCCDSMKTFWVVTQIKELYFLHQESIDIKKQKPAKH